MWVENYICAGVSRPITPPPPFNQKSVVTFLTIVQFTQDLPCSAKL